MYSLALTGSDSFDGWEVNADADFGRFYLSGDYGFAARDEVLATYLADNTQAREMLGSGSYRRLAPNEDEPRINSQSWLLKHRSEKRSDV